MKKIFLIMTAMCLLFFGTVQAQNFNPKKNNYVVLTKNIKQLNPIMLTASDLAKEDGKKYGEFYVIICGKTVKDISENEVFKTNLTKAEELGVKVFVCGLSLSKFKVSTSTLPEMLNVTKNGILFGFQLSKKGFIALTI